MAELTAVEPQEMELENRILNEKSVRKQVHKEVNLRESIASFLKKRLFDRVPAPGPELPMLAGRCRFAVS